MTAPTRPRMGSLFTGTGMLDHGVMQMFVDAVLAFVAEYEPPATDKKTGKVRPGRQAPAQILAHRHPTVPNLGDISKIDWSLWVGLIEILTGGFPCQDVSLAGARAGITVDSRSGMWQHYALAISILRPSLVVIENVRGLLSAKAGDHDEITDDEGWTDDEIAQLEAEWPQGQPRADRSVELGEAVLGEPARDSRPLLNAFGSVAGDLAELGYVAVWTGVQASDAGAPHARWRVFVVARPADDNSSAGWARPAENADRAARGERGVAAAREETGGGHGPTLADEIEHGLTRPTVADPAGVVGERDQTGGLGAETPGAAAGGGSADDGSGPAEAVALLPSIRATDGVKGGPNQRGSKGDLTINSAVQLFPTATAADGQRTSETYAGGNPTLGGATALLPTPVANDSGNSVEAHLRKKPGRTEVTSLQIIAEHVLPTVGREDVLRSGEPLLPGLVEIFPTPSTSNANGNQTNNRGELLLPGVAESLPTLLPTPLTTDAKQMGPADLGRESVQLRGEVTLFPTPTTQETHSGPSQDNRNTPPLNAVAALLPTPVAAEGTKATTMQGVEQKSQTGQVWLTNVAHDIERPQVATGTTVEEYRTLWESLDDQSPYWRTGDKDYWPAISRWARILGRPAPSPTIPDGEGGRFRLSARFAEWMMGMPDRWVTGAEIWEQPDVLGKAWSASAIRNAQLKACGNGVVWQQAALAMNVLMPMLWEIS